LEVLAVASDFHAQMNAIATWEEVPIFDSEDAEAAFWQESRVDLRLMESAVAASSQEA